MAPRKNNGSTTTKRVVNKGVWTAEEDRRLSEYIEVHGAKRWKTVAINSGLSRCGKSCRLRWLNYLRPNIKRGNISDDEEDLILRLHKLLGNRWALIAGRLPGRTDNEIKNYWNSHLSKKMNQNQDDRISESSIQQQEIVKVSGSNDRFTNKQEDNEEGINQVDESMVNFNDDELFDFSNGSSYGLDWVNKFLELDGDPWLT